VLIDIVGVEQRRGLEGGQQVLGDGFDERLGVAVLGEALESGTEAVCHLVKSFLAWVVKAVNSGWPKMVASPRMGSVNSM
jgi:hypothetical protein